jgi:hypothetical protein
MVTIFSSADQVLPGTQHYTLPMNTICISINVSTIYRLKRHVKLTYLENVTGVSKLRASVSLHTKVILTINYVQIFSQQRAGNYLVTNIFGVFDF